MNLDLSVDQQAFIDSLVKSGRFASASEAIGEAVRLLVSQERLKQEVEVGTEQADRGDVADHDTVFAQLRSMAATIEREDG
ncbi:MAG: type II toxin-antitoxin system ParD family antitoxin [Planctomycetota bacterium]|nr:MAG: type II toxin-antitoxin system ParD family antitoxin [Planctomycetota bacterium]REK25343.1 MAG: type II toxin-antitoxin system ParD family antitoxin [Planctomycetota bacterium]REK43478.1 MAG: type II toxin-antitoxin system ParD family antitoxin [Planctomycetota bacterium]